MPINEIPIGYVAIETDTRKPYTGGASSGAKIFRTLGLAQGAIKRQFTKRQTNLNTLHAFRLLIRTRLYCFAFLH